MTTKTYYQQADPKNNEAKEEHQKQAYINSWLAHKNGHTC